MQRIKRLGLAGIALILLTTGPMYAADIAYEGFIDVGLDLKRIVADPIRQKVYGITETGDVAFINSSTMSVDRVISTGRVLRDIDITHDNSRLTVLDNVTGEYWNQPPATYLIEYLLDTQAQAGIKILQAPLYQMAHGRSNRVVGIQTNQWVNAYQVDATTGSVLSTAGAGYYGGTSWSGPNLFLTNNAGTRLYRTEIGISSIELIVFDTSTDNITQIDSRTVGSYSDEPVFLNSSETSLYVGDIRLNPNNIDQVLGAYPENILAATGDDTMAFGVNGVYDPLFGGLLAPMPTNARFPMMVIGNADRTLYTFDEQTQRLHVLTIPEPGAVALIAIAVPLVLVRRRSTTVR